MVFLPLAKSGPPLPNNSTGRSIFTMLRPFLFGSQEAVDSYLILVIYQLHLLL